MLCRVTLLASIPSPHSGTVDIGPVTIHMYGLMLLLARWAAPLLWVEGRQTDVARHWGDRYPRAEFEARLAVVPRVERVVLEDCGHMLHLDQPRALAEALLAFLER